MSLTGLRLYLHELSDGPERTAEREIELPARAMDIRVRTASGQTFEIVPWGECGITVRATDGSIVQRAVYSNVAQLAAYRPSIDRLSMRTDGPVLEALAESRARKRKGGQP